MGLVALLHMSSHPGLKAEGAAPMWDILFLRQRGRTEWWQKHSDPKLLLGWAILCVHTHAVSQCYSHVKSTSVGWAIVH